MINKKFFFFFFLLLLLGGTEALGDGAALAVLDGAGADDTLVDGAGDAHAGLHVELGEREALVVDGRVLGDIAGGGLVEHVADDEALDGLVLGGETAAVGAVSGGGATTGVLGAAVISTLTGHFWCCCLGKFLSFEETLFCCEVETLECVFFFVKRTYFFA